MFLATFERLWILWSEIKELKIKDSVSLNMIVEALTRNGYHLEIATKWKEWPQSGIDCFCVLVKEKEDV